MNILQIFISIYHKKQAVVENFTINEIEWVCLLVIYLFMTITYCHSNKSSRIHLKIFYVGIEIYSYE